MSDDICLKVVELYLSERKRGAAGGNLSSRCVRAAKETSYQWKAERCMADENCFKVRICSGKMGLEALRLRGGQRYGERAPKRERRQESGVPHWLPEKPAAYSSPSLDWLSK